MTDWSQNFKAEDRQLDPKFWQLLGLAMRAGEVISGEEQVLKAMRRRQAYLILVSGDASPNTKKRICDKASFYQIPCCQVGDRYQMGQAIGRMKRVVVAVTNRGFADGLRRYITA